MRLFPTMFRFDNVYHLRFKLNEALISESYPHLQRWLEEVRHGFSQRSNPSAQCSMYPVGSSPAWPMRCVHQCILAVNPADSLGCLARHARDTV